MTTWAQYVENINYTYDLLTLLMGKNDNISINCWITISVSFIILLHNLYIHRFSKISVNRICVDMMCFANIVKNAGYLRCSYDGCSEDDVIIFYTILHCIGLAIFQMVDNYWTYYIYQMVSSPPPSLIFKCLVLMYSPLMYTWFIYDIIFPSFIVLDSEGGWILANIVLYGFFYFSYLIFFLYLTNRELRKMSANLNSSTDTYSTLSLNSYKIIAYNIANILLNMLWMSMAAVSSDAYTIGDIWWSTTLLFYQHLAFNTSTLDYAIYATIDYINLHVIHPVAVDDSFSMESFPPSYV